MNERIPDWMLERYALGELPPDRAAEIGERIAGRPEEEARLRALREADRAFLAAHPPRNVVAAIQGRLKGRAGARRPLAFRRPVLASLAAAASLALVLGLFLGEEEDEGIRTKGLVPALVVHRSRGGEIERLAEGALARAGDLVQLSYVAAGMRHGLVLSIDGSGVVSLHHPVTGEWAAELDPRGTIALPHAYELDAAPEFERFFFVFSDDPFRVHEVLEAARRAPTGAERLPLDDHLEQVSFLLRKP